MHYANGRAAKIGDLVRGRGYNLKHEFTGVLVHATPASSACNCQIATVTSPAPGTANAYKGVVPNLDGNGWDVLSYASVKIEPQIEYGQLDAFLALDPATGEVLPPQSDTTFSDSDGADYAGGIHEAFKKMGA